MKEDIRNTYNYIRANEKTILSQKHSLARMDVTVQVTALLGSTQQTGVGSTVFCGIVSAVFGRNLKPALGVIGNISIGGAVERAVNFLIAFPSCQKMVPRPSLFLWTTFRKWPPFQPLFWARLTYLSTAMRKC